MGTSLPEKDSKGYAFGPKESLLTFDIKISLPNLLRQVNHVDKIFTPLGKKVDLYYDLVFSCQAEKKGREVKFVLDTSKFICKVQLPYLTTT